MSEALSNRIAAGEVIERPASVVKELVENAIDAGAKKIIVEIERAGTKAIIVSDNGCGMDMDDLQLCIEPHGTSKLTKLDDLEKIITLGFRGEAIPSIAAVSNFEIYSRQPQCCAGAVMQVNGGKAYDPKPAGGPPGTKVAVRDLFFNTPARKKFLKSLPTEENHITELMQNIVLGYPEISFDYIIDKRIVWRLVAGDLQQRIRELFGKDFVSKVIVLQHKEQNMLLHGVIAIPGFTRSGRREQRIFINQRPVESNTIFRGIKDGYDAIGYESGRYPPVILFLTMPPEDLDINVHPAKREVRFKSDYAVTGMISRGIANTLRQENNKIHDTNGKNSLRETFSVKDFVEASSINYQPKQQEQKELKFSLSESPKHAIPVVPQNVPTNKTASANNYNLPPIPENTLQNESINQQANTEKTKTPVVFPRESLMPAPATRPVGAKIAPNLIVDDEPSTGENFSWPSTVLGIYDSTYLLCAGENSLVLVDQHAAHERIMYEAIMNDYKSGSIVEQRLLLPITVELSAPRYAMLLRHKKTLNALGFDFEPAGGRIVILSSLPQRLADQRPIEEIIIDLVDELLDNNARHLPMEPSYIARAACRSAIKAHEELSIAAAQKLLEALKRCRQGTLCPHGRPVMISITKRELEHRFQRR